MPGPETNTITGMRPVEGTSLTAGSRDYAITIERDGYEDIEAFMLFDGVSETFDPTSAIEFTTHDDPDTMHQLRVGDVIKMRVVINT